jgi:hypothetical protein
MMAFKDGRQRQQTPNLETRNLNPDVIAAQGLYWVNLPSEFLNREEPNEDESHCFF